VPSDLSKPLRATLAWTDAPGAVSSCPSLVNDLDLELVQDGKMSWRGNAFNNGSSTAGGPTDFLNNVEQVIQPAPSGHYTLTVRAAALAGDGVPGNADSTDQDFALVVSNATVYSGPILAAGAVTPAEACPGSGAGSNGVIDPGETVILSVPLVNSGDVMATGVTATLAPPPPGVILVDGSASYPDIAAGGMANPLPGDTISVALTDTFSCGGNLDLVLNVATGQGSFPVPLHFDVGAKTVTNQNLSGTTGQVNDDINNPSNFTTPAATSGTLRSVSLDLNIISSDVSFLFEDYGVALISPQSTSVTLHSNPLPCAGLITNYPSLRLPQAGSLDVFKGENAGGIWTLRVTDRNNFVSSGPPVRPGSEGTVNSWSVHLTRESAPACNTCTVATPPEVSAPASSTPLSLTYNEATGEVTFSWENLGSEADVYRLFSGTIGSLAGSGVTASNASPVLCGDAIPGATLIPPSGDRFFLVAAQKGFQLGSLGSATNPIAFPRSAGQTCP
jgi:subtilisin-like proprotein convertase family protein